MPAKKTTKKASAKKAVKKTAKKTKTNKSCSCKAKCTSKQAFWVNNGPVVHSVQELLEALKDISDEQYAYHTKREGNDFATWVKDCLKDDAAATSLKKVRSRAGAVRVLSEKCACK
jgi:acyl-homoserine lactone acylase PvdQ